MVAFSVGFAARLLPANDCRADEPPVPTFERYVRPILKKHCFHCHGEEESPEGSLDLRLVRLMKAGGDTGTAIVEGHADESLLYQRLRQGEMPPDESKLLSKSEVATIRSWIDAGAATEGPEPEAISDGLLITEPERQHWAFQVIRRPATPTDIDTEQIQNPIDAFVLRRLQQAGLDFSDRAVDHTLIRRLYVDLHGLPPNLSQQQVDVSTPEAWAELVDDLLGSEEYGERWARHWLDVAGYADSEGYNDADAVRPHAWRYRDYVIRSLNADKPLDRFIHEQLAGDEMIQSPLSNLTPEDAELLVATGFLRMAPDGTGGSVPEPELARNATIADTLRIVSTAFFGLTIGCAQCHDHRYDPISHRDYYELRAVFDPALDWKTWRSPNQRLVSLYTDEDRARAAVIEAEAKEIDAEHKKKQTQFIEATFERELAKLPAAQREAARAARDTPAKERTEDQKAILKAYPSLNVSAGSLYLYDRKAADELKALSAKAAKVRQKKPGEEMVRALTEVDGHRPASYVFFRGDHEQPKDEVQPAGLEVVSLNAELPGLDPQEPVEGSSGRRLALARRLTHPNHPLTARVIVNRVWMHHFGQGLVTTPGDFGIQGEPPTHPALLDWLAAELMDSGWSLKHLHRLILTSRTWQQSSGNPDDVADEELARRLYSGVSLQRLDAETLRDSVLSVSGQLNRRRFGPPVPVMADSSGRFVIGKENLNAGRPGDVIDLKGEQFRRSVYIQVRRSRPLDVLRTFDLPEMTPNCEARRPSTSALQSLTLMNSDQIVSHAEEFAKRLVTLAGPDQRQQIVMAWKLAYCREPSPEEIKQAVLLIDDLKPQEDARESPAEQADGEEASPADPALAVLCQMLLSSNEFLYVD